MTTTTWRNLDEWETADRINAIISLLPEGADIKVNGHPLVRERWGRKAYGHATGSVSVTVKARSKRSATGTNTIYIKHGDTVAVEHDQFGADGVELPLA